MLSEEKGGIAARRITWRNCHSWYLRGCRRGHRLPGRNCYSQALAPITQSTSVIAMSHKLWPAPLPSN